MARRSAVLVAGETLDNDGAHGATSTETSMTTTGSATPAGVVRELSMLDRFLPVWIITAMSAGRLLGRFAPGVSRELDSLHVTSGVALPSGS